MPEYGLIDKDGAHCRIGKLCHLGAVPVPMESLRVIPRESGESSTPQRLGLLDPPLSRGMTAERC
jgi:hypothetical protein